MNGACTRWAVLYKHDQMPIEGCVYANKAKAIKRLKGMADPTKFTIGEVCVMPKELMMRLLDAFPGSQPPKVA